MGLQNRMLAHGLCQRNRNSFAGCGHNPFIFGRDKFARATINSSPDFFPNAGFSGLDV